MRRALPHSKPKAFVDSLPQLAWFHTAQFQDCEFNSAWGLYLGMEDRPITTGTWADSIHPDDRSAALQSVKTAIIRNESYTVHYRIANKSGRYNPVISNGIYRPPREKRGPAWLAVTVQLKDCRPPTTNDHNLEQRLSALQRASNVVFWIADPGGQVSEHWGWDSLTDQASKDAIGWGWLDTVHPDDKVSLKRAWQNCVRNSRPFHGEYRLRSRDGTFKWVEGQGTPIRSDTGEILEWIGTVSDISERKARERELIRSEEQLRLALESTQMGIWDVDFRTGEQNWTDKTFEILEIDPRTRIKEDTFLKLVHPDDRDLVEQSFFSENQEGGNIYNGSYRVITDNGKSEKWIFATGITITDEHNKPARKIGTIRDITDRVKSDLSIKEGEKQLRLALNAARMNAWEIDLESGFVKRSENTEHLLGLRSGSIDAFLENTHPEDRELVLSFLNHQTNTQQQINLRYQHPDGRKLWLGMRGERSEGNRLRGVTFDITTQIQAEQELWRMAHEDDLTGLLNRSTFNKILEEKCSCESSMGKRFYVAIVDIDEFKEVNDTFGHDAGDLLLKRAASQIQKAFKETESIARIGGDEFAILFTLNGSHSALTEELDRLHRCLRKPITIAGRTFSTQSSVGVATFPTDGSTAKELMKSADIALYRAKASGRNRTTYYNAHMRDNIVKRVELFSEFDRALSQRELLVYYQPKIALTDGKLIGYEALLRWHHPARGVLTPAAFGTVFENFELSQAIGNLVLEQITDDLRHWHLIGINPGRIAFNLSSADFFADNLSYNILNRLRLKSLPTSSIEVEITEDVFLNNTDINIDTHLETLSKSGIKIALDDFGTGFASLTHLKRFPIDNIKIDRSFISNISLCEKDRSIISAIVSLSKELGIQTTAEGVENLDQLKILKDISCNNIQGYLISPAMHPDKIPDFRFSLN